MQAAPDPAAVARIIEDYARTIPPQVASLLPEECRQALEDPDVQSAALTILHCELGFKGSALVAEALHEIAHTYAAASLRITRFSKSLT